MCFLRLYRINIYITSKFYYIYCRWFILELYLEMPKLL